MDWTRNLLTDTKAAFDSIGKTSDDVLWVGGNEQWFTWDEFTSIANVEYDAGYGAQEIAADLVVVFEDCWLVRHEYDGAEGWECCTPPTRPDRHEVPKQVHGGAWSSIKEIEKRNR